MKIFEIIQDSKTGRRRVYFCGIKIASFKCKEHVRTCYNRPTTNFNTLENSTLSLDANMYNNKISIIYSLYFQNKNCNDLTAILDVYDKFSDEIKKKFELIIVDDCSPYPPKLSDKYNLNITLLRILEDKKWNACGGRNLGACYATTEKLLMMDIDHYIEEETLNNLINCAIKEDVFILFNGLHDSQFGTINQLQSIHPNIFATLKRTFLNYNGYDEDIVGTYGDDVWFRKNLENNNIQFIKTGFIYALINNFPEHNLSRDLTGLKKYLEKKSQHTRIMLNFPWKFVDRKELHIS